MNRRTLIKAGLAASIAGVSDVKAENTENHFYELRTYQLRNDLKSARVMEFHEKHFIPAAKKAGVVTVGCFTVVSGQQTPSLIVLVEYKSMADLSVVRNSLMDNKEYIAAWKEFETGVEIPYVRFESSLLRAFDGHRQSEIPKRNKEARLFELRTYESRNQFSLRDKLDMFNREEIQIFRDSGFAPVFFGSGVFGTRLPSLTYMVGFDNMEAREKCWKTFVSSEAFNRIKKLPGWTDPEAVSNIYGSFLRPTAFSDIY